VIVLPSGKKVFPEQDLEEELAHCPTVEEFAIRAVGDEERGERIGIIIRPDIEVLRERGVTNLSGLYGAIKADIDEALGEKPDYMKQYDFCLTAWGAGAYSELVKSAMGDPCPLKNAFTPETAYSRRKGSDEPAPWV
jgi:hypothetical protein